MRTERRRRTLAAVVVIATVAGTAYAQLAITSSPAPTNGAIPASTPGNIVFSIRNTSSQTLDIVSFTPQGQVGCTGVTIGRLDNPSMQAAMLAPNEQQQFIAQAPNGFAAGPADCIWDIATNPMTGATITTSFTIGTSTGGDVQPTQMSFGSQYTPSSEVQSLFVTSYGSAAQAWASITSTSTKFSFTGGCTGTTCSCTTSSCSFMLPAQPGTVTLDVMCQPMFNGDLSPGTIDVYTMGTLIGSGFIAGTGSGPGSAYLGSITLTCDAYGTGIKISNAPISIMTMPGLQGFGSADIVSQGTGSAYLAGASITSNDTSFKITDCNGTNCTFTPATLLPTTLTIECVGGATSTSGTLLVYDTSGGSDTANVTCVSMGSPGMLDVNPTTLDFQSHDVGTTTPSYVTLKNTGGTTLSDIVIDPPVTNPGDWTVTSCPSATPCSLAPNQTMMVPVSFHPIEDGDRSSSFTISGGTTIGLTVTLLGTGLGAVLDVTEPVGPPYDLDFGTIPRNQAFMRTLTVANVGHKAMSTTVSGETAPYSIMPSSSVSIGGLSSQSYVVSCQSATPSSSNEQTLLITTDAYKNSTANVSLHCQIANTEIQVMPQQLDFGEVRVGTATQSITITVTNPATASIAANISSFALRDTRTGLTLSSLSSTTLQPGQSATATLSLATAAESDLTGELLDIGVDGTMLALPVTGKVVTAKSRIVPDTLDLGTACVGTQVGGTVMLINEGTATLAVQAPQMDMSFLAAGPPGSMFPTMLSPMSSLSANVSPAMSATGPLTGTLTWKDDVPNEYKVPVKLEYVSSGTAISPAQLDFGSVAVDAAALPQHITIENCDLTPTSVTIKSITTHDSPVAAWVLEPRLGYTKMLPAREKQAITVQFRPPARGRYEADLDIVTSIGPKRIHLRGDATGRDFDRTSFYACACESPVSPTHGWPIIAAIVIIIVRRRRGSSSAR